MVKKEANTRKTEVILKKLDSIEKRLINIEKDECLIKKEQELLDQKEEAIKKEEEKIDQKLDKITKEEQDIEKTLLKIWRFSFKKRHLLELTRASAGAFLGVGLGRGLLGLDNLAKTLPWLNIIGIFLFIIILSTLLIYKTERMRVKEEGFKVVLKKLVFMYAISLVIEVFSLFLFGSVYTSNEMLIKILIIGSFSAMGSAVSFSLI